MLKGSSRTRDGMSRPEQPKFCLFHCCLQICADKCAGRISQMRQVKACCTTPSIEVVCRGRRIVCLYFSADCIIQLELLEAREANGSPDANRCRSSQVSVHGL